MKKIKAMTLSPTYMKQFQCIAEKCEDNCCAGWNVFVDKQTYQKYKNVRDPEWKAAFKQVRRAKPALNDAQYATIEMNSGCHTCPFLAADRRCSIHSSFGEEYLSWVCRDYPRSYHIVGNTVEYTAALSCPEMTRLALFNQEGITFTQQEEQIDHRTTINRDVLQEAKVDPMRYHYESLRFAAIRIMQDRRKPLSFRLLFIGKMLEHVQNNWNPASPSSIEDTIVSFLHHWENAETPAMTDGDSHIHAKLTLYTHIANEMKAHLNLSSFIETWNEAVQGWETGIEKEIYQQLEYSFLSYMSAHAYVQENYLVHKIFAHMFPFSHPTMQDSFTYLILSHSVLQWLLMGISASRPLTDEVVTETVYRFERQLSHNKVFQETLLSWMKTEGYDTLAFLALLTI